MQGQWHSYDLPIIFPWSDASSSRLRIIDTTCISWSFARVGIRGGLYVIWWYGIALYPYAKHMIMQGSRGTPLENCSFECIWYYNSFKMLSVKAFEKHALVPSEYALTKPLEARQVPYIYSGNFHWCKISQKCLLAFRIIFAAALH